MVAVVFNSLRVAKKLKKEGLPPQQADVIVEAMTDMKSELATRQDIKNLEKSFVRELVTLEHKISDKLTLRIVGGIFVLFCALGTLLAYIWDKLEPVISKLPN
jgi:hypothetical protein